mgnify:CR=1 FL=1
MLITRRRHIHCLALLLLSFILPSAYASLPWDLKHQISVAHYDRNYLNWDLPHPPSPLFWSASTKVDTGWVLMYEQTIYHNKRFFSLDAGSNASYWHVNAHGNTQPAQSLYTLSGFLSMHVWIPMSRVHPYLYYSVAGPTLMSDSQFSTTRFSNDFSFQDQLGIGILFNKKPNIDLALKMIHYSNGDVFPINGGIDVPVVVSLGIRF